MPFCRPYNGSALHWPRLRPQCNGGLSLALPPLPQGSARNRTRLSRIQRDNIKISELAVDVHRAHFAALCRLNGRVVIHQSAGDNLIANYTNFLLLLVYGFVPWTAINLTDYYIVRHGNYDVPAFFDPKGIYYRNPATFTYAGFSILALAAYALGVASQLPFINTTYWTGLAVDSLGGADISWIIGLIVSAGSYLLLTRAFGSQPGAEVSKPDAVVEQTAPAVS